MGGSDLVYPGNAGRQCVSSNSEKSLPPADVVLMELLAKLAGPETEVILALKDRTGEVARFASWLDSPEATKMWATARTPSGDLMQEFRNMSALHVIHLQKRK